MSRITKAVILAAGMGLRMKDMGEEIPKGFIRLGGSPIIEPFYTGPVAETLTFHGLS